MNATEQKVSEATSSHTRTNAELGLAKNGTGPRALLRELVRRGLSEEALGVAAALVLALEEERRLDKRGETA